MKEGPGRWPLPVLAVLGAGDADADELDVARRIGGMAARAGWVVATGGGPGAMEAACRGAAEAGGLTLGVLPTDRPAGGYPNPWVAVPVYTGAGYARNAFLVLTADVCVAVGGGAGTLSEIALACKSGTEVWAWRSWAATPPRAGRELAVTVFDDPAELARRLARR